ncbi:MAG: enoyl-CoA hydratase/isomerase family protein [Chloroflexi bacterium]|nr:enoyl-CoA hydratase/isomerase family protein [Chloroflexota bacterium]
MADFTSIVFDKRDRRATITLNRPDKLNALSPAMYSELDVVLTDLENDRSVKVVVVKGAGRAFSVGVDQDPQSPGRKMEDIGEDRRRLNTLVGRWLRIWDLGKPVIAQVHGYCIGVACQMASMCDLTVVSDDCKIGLPTAGPLGAGLAAAQLCNLVGPKKAREMCYIIGRLMDGNEAVRIGWANRAVPADKLEEEVDTLAAEIAEMPLEYLELQKNVINKYVEMSGFRTAAYYGADVDALAHFTKPVQSFLKLVRERGLKQAKQDWKKEIV